ncbi:MAG TPA: tripartite tricarboxylate transporter substrate binding protein [Burkholderiaceae bacterium]|nr:tripartite tricarboxylate transporter substrate binding protein [Burkholderiaceae bacterium]
MKLFRVMAAAASALFAMNAAPVLAQTYPTKPITIVVGFAPGGVTDVISRLFGQKLSEQLGQPVVVENKPGSGGNIATDFVARAAPDGYTLQMWLDSNTIAPALYKKLNHDPIKDFTHISLLAVGSHVIVAHPSFAPNNMKELIEYVKANPGLPYASSGSGTAQHLGGEQLKTLAGIDMTHIPYKGGGQAINDVVGGQVKLAVLGLAPVLPHIKAGKLKALAVTGDKRSPALPGVPTVVESGVPGLTTLQWFGVVAPAGTPAPIVARLHAEFAKAAKDPVIIERINAVGLEMSVSAAPADLTKFLRNDMAKWPPIVKAAGATVD